MTLRRMVTVRVPATSANMGPGFDALGLALNVYNDLTVRTDVERFTITVEGEGAGSLPLTDDNLVIRGLKLAFTEAGYATVRACARGRRGAQAYARTGCLLTSCGNGKGATE